MAAQTEVILRAFLERLVAIVAVGLVFRVRFTQLTRHNQAFETVERTRESHLRTQPAGQYNKD